MAQAPSMDSAAREALHRTRKLLNRLHNRKRGVERRERYFRGEHPLVYATPEWRVDHEHRFKGFSDNWCGVVGTAPVERTNIDGFRLGNSTDDMTEVERLLLEDWSRNEMEAQQSQGFLMSTIAKRSGVIVWGDPDTELPVATWERPDQVVFDYDPERPFTPRRILKAWRDDDVEKATLYESGFVWKWQRPAAFALRDRDEAMSESGLILPRTVITGFGGWEPRTDDDVWPIKNPLGEPPGAEFVNRPVLGSEPLSDIDGAIAMQHAINLLWAYLFVAADFASMPARVVLGAKPPTVPILNDQGQKIGEREIDLEALQKGRMMFLQATEGKIAQWDAAKLDVFTSVVNVAVKHLASQTRTPIHYIVGDLGNVNGETLTATETPLGLKVQANHAVYKPAVRRINRLFALVRNDRTTADACLTGTVLWRNPFTRSEAQLADAATKDIAVGWPFAAVLERRYGLTQPEIDRVLKMKKDEQNSSISAMVQNALRLPPPAQPTGEPPVPPEQQ